MDDDVVSASTQQWEQTRLHAPVMEKVNILGGLKPSHLRSSMGLWTVVVFSRIVYSKSKRVNCEALIKSQQGYF
jgi:hypothetical protein